MNKYYVSNRTIEIILFLIDYLILFLINLKILKINRCNYTSYKNVLISNMGALGDAVLSTAAVYAIKNTYRNVKISFICEEDTKPIFESCSLIDKIYSYKHPIGRKGRHFDIISIFNIIGKLRKIISDIKKIQYDISIELFPRIQNNIFLFWLANIPIRIGYDSGGFGNLLTNPKKFVLKNQHMTQYYFDLLEDIFVEPLTDVLFPIMGIETEISIKLSNYIIIHMGSYSNKRTWDNNNWIELINMLQKRNNYLIVFTGRGKYEHNNIINVINNIKGKEIDLCDKISVRELLAIVKRAKLVISLDTAIVHIASAFKVPCIVICTGIHPNIWYPFYNNSIMCYYKTQCSPCYIENGCSEMNCIRKLKVIDVYKTIVNIDNSYK